MDYQEFLARKNIFDPHTGHEPGKINNILFDFQRDIVRWALRRGRAAIFADCGLGKTLMQLEWAKHVYSHTCGNVLILAPLAVSPQTKKEGEKADISVNIAATQDDIVDGINITNYEKLHNFDCNAFSGIVLDESSIIKHHTSKTRDQLLQSFAQTPYRLACTATPSWNSAITLNFSE
jgi:superfamily II DNA or RNA helicase